LQEEEIVSYPKFTLFNRSTIVADIEFRVNVKSTSDFSALPETFLPDTAGAVFEVNIAFN
jgi:hypothetical protein